LQKLTDTLGRHDLITTADAILLAISGGLDSVAMLDLMSQLRENYQLTLGVIHVHHGLRGREADEDLAFVEDLAAHYELPFFYQKVKTRELARSRKLSLEEAARVLRYQAFEQCLDRKQYHKVATAHTADDQAETVLDHVLRGSGSLGLAGMPMKRDRLIRPLLEVPRNELEEYVKERGLKYRVDSTNRDLRYRRNRIRLELIPYLQKHFNENLTDTLNRTAVIFSEYEAFLREQAEQAFQTLVLLQRKNQIVLEIKGFLKYFILLRKYILFTTFEKVGLKRAHVNFHKLENILVETKRNKVGTRLPVDQEFEILIDHDGLVVQASHQETPSPAHFNLVNSEKLAFGEFDIQWTILENNETITFEPDRAIEFLDFEKTGADVCLRTLRPGDRFIPLNFNGHKKIADFFSDRKIPHRLREMTPILESSNGIAWICGYCIDDRFKITQKTRKVVKFEIRKSENGA